MDKFDSDLEKAKYGISEAKQIFKKYGVLTRKYSTTSIRGYHNIKEHGYEIEKYDCRNISFSGVSITQYEKIINEMKNSGFVLCINSTPNEKNSSGSFTIKSFTK